MIRQACRKCRKQCLFHCSKGFKIYAFIVVCLYFIVFPPVVRGFFKNTFPFPTLVCFKVYDKVGDGESGPLSTISFGGFGRGRDKIEDLRRVGPNHNNETFPRMTLARKNTLDPGHTYKQGKTNPPKKRTTPSLTPQTQPPRPKSLLDPFGDRWRTKNVGGVRIHMYSAFLDDRAGKTVTINVAAPMNFRCVCV